MMQKLVQFIVLFYVAILISGCNNDDTSKFYFDEESSKAIADKIPFDAKGGNVNLIFYHDETADINIESETNDWLHAQYTSIDRESSQLTIKCLQNSSPQVRNGSIVLWVNEERTVVYVQQKAAQRILIENKHVLVDSQGGKVTVKCQTDGDIDVSLYLYPDWIRVSDIKETTDGREVILSVDENMATGRIAKMFVNGEDNGFEWIAIQQKPAVFGEKVILETKGEGQLDVLLGNDTENLRRIRSLTIRGAINGYDIYTLQKMFVTSNALGKPLDYPLALDLSEAIIYGNYNNIYEEEFHFDIQLPNDRVIFSNHEIPDYMFSYAENLTAISLPHSTKIIGKQAFRNCTALSSVNIPEDVWYIKDSAFLNCSATQININRLSALKKIDGYVFSTTSEIESLRLPDTLEDIAENAFSGCTCKELIVYWLTPPELRVLPNPTNCILYIPKGAKDAYLASAYWNRYSQIVETTEYWED